MPTDLPDDSTLWTTASPTPGSILQGQSMSVTCLPSTGAALISGNLDAAIAALAPGAALLGLLDARPHTPFALRIARDRALLITAEPLDLVPGWHDGFAVSPADDLYLVLAITGEGARGLQDACLSAPAGSPSAATPFGGHACLVLDNGQGPDVWVPAPEAAALWLRLSRLVAALD
ncbi:MAG: hypothetical protein KI788_22730 [Mameliella sp.]|nr:hypothetical protein [Mameliella sp.]